MFRRRYKRHWLQKAREAFWPKAGWGRTVAYWGHRILRMEGTPHSVAAGLASGVAMSMTPFLGLHFLLSALLAWVIRGNVVAGLVGTFIGNPWTFPFIWLFTYRIGCFLLGIEPGAHPDFAEAGGSFFSNPFQAVMPTLGPMMLGALPTAATAWCLVYFPVRRLVEIRRHHRRERLALAQLQRKKT